MWDSIKTAQNKKLVMCIRVRLTRFAFSYFRQEKEWKREREKERKREREKERKREREKERKRVCVRNT